MPTVDLDGSITAVSTWGSGLFLQNDNVMYSEVSSSIDDGVINITAQTVVNQAGGSLAFSNTIVPFFRFQGLTLPRGAYVAEAYLYLTTANTNVTSFNVQITAQKQPYSWIPSSYGDYVGRPQTSAVSVVFPAMTPSSVWVSPNLAPVVQEVMDYGGAVGDTALVFFTSTSVNSSNATIVSRDSSSTGMAKLLVQLGTYKGIPPSSLTALTSMTAAARYQAILTSSITGVATFFNPSLPMAFAIAADLTGSATMTAPILGPPQPQIVSSITGTATFGAGLVSLRQDVYTATGTFGASLLSLRQDSYTGSATLTGDFYIYRQEEYTASATLTGDLYSLALDTYTVSSSLTGELYVYGLSTWTAEAEMDTSMLSLQQSVLVAEVNIAANLSVTRNVAVARVGSGFDFGDTDQFRLMVDGDILSVSS